MKANECHDVTERQQLDFIQRVGRVGYWEFDPAKRSTFLPDPSLHLLASIVGGSLGARGSFMEALCDPDRKRFQIALDQAIATHSALHIELKLAGNDGRQPCIAVRGAHIETGQGPLRFAGTFQDITNEKQREADHEHVSTQLQALLDALPQGVSVIDRDLRLILWNQRFHEILGFPQDMVFRHARFEDFIRLNAMRGEYGPGDPEEQVQAIVALAREFVPHRFERQLSGGRTVQVEGFPFTFGGEISGFVTTYTDITDQKRAGEELTRQRDVMKTVIDNFPGGISLCDPDLRFTTYNDRFLELLDFPPSLFSKGWVHFEELARFNANRGEYGPGDPEEHVQAVVARAKNFQAHRMERARPNGRWLEIRGMPLASGGFVTSYIDITERKRIEEALRANEALLRLVTEDVLDVVWKTDRDLRFTYISPADERLRGYRADEVIGHHVFEMFTAEGIAAVTEIMRQRQEAERHGIQTDFSNFEVQHRCKDGTLLWGEVFSTVERDAHGTISGYHGITREITKRKQAEAARAELEGQLRESQKMEALGTLAGGVAHDFNNALAMIIGNAELARQDVGPDHAALVSLEEIDKASRRAKDLVQQILAFGRRQTLERKATSLALVVVESARLLRASLPAKVSLNVISEGDTPAVLADATQVKQLLLNLCGNAVQAVQDQERPGVIEVRLEAHAQVEARGDLRPGRYACLTVRDNGSGMDESTRSRIFEPFFTTKPVGKGTGLGLSVVHGIAQAHEACIAVESIPGEGSTFRIYFPAMEAPVPADTVPATNAAPVHGKGRHVLYVDDEEAIIFLMKRLLERQGFRVSGYTDPREALAAARASLDQFDLAVTDYNMPGMSGLEVASALKEIRADLPVVMASGYITEELRAKAPAAGIRELIYKPNTVDDLCEAVARFANAQSRNKSSS